MATSGVSRSRRRERAPKPLSVPAIVAALGFILFFLGIFVGNVDLSALGAIFFIWGVSSCSVILLTRRRRSAKQVKGC
jgi:hypothetical protein